MNNQAAQTMPTLPRPYWKAGDVKDDYGNPYNETDLFTDDDMRAMYQQGYAAALSQTAGVPDARPALQCDDDGNGEYNYNMGWNDCRAAMLAAAPAASGGEDKGDPVCREDDGCPTEGAVLKRFWRAVNTDDTKQLMAFYGVADVPALIEQQVQHVQSLQIKLKAHEPKRDQFPKSPREG